MDRGGDVWLTIEESRKQRKKNSKMKEGMINE